MSRKKRGGAANEQYRNHLFGTAFQNNPDVNTEQAKAVMYERVLSELAMNRFKWEGFPPSIDVRFLERNLFYNALCVFYKNDKYNTFLALQGSGTRYLNMLNNPTAFTVVGNNFVGETISAKDCVPIWANYMRVPDIDIVKIFSRSLAKLDETVDINAENARQSKVLISGENQRLSVANFDQQVAEGRNGIRVAGPLQDLAFIQALDLGINPDLLEKLDIVRARKWNVAMGLLGIENANQDKKERLVSGEVDANNGQVSAMKDVNLNARKIAAAQINEKFGAIYNFEVSVSYNSDVEKQAAEMGEMFNG